MDVTRTGLRERFASMSDADLHQVVAAPPGTYTLEALEEARVVIDDRARRAEEREPARPSVSYAVEEALSAPYRRWRSLVPEHVPAGIRRLFYVGVAIAVPAFVVVLIALLRSSDLRAAARDNAYVVLAGVAGLCLAYGVRAEKRFVQYLGAALVVAAAATAIIDELLADTISTGMFVVGGAAVATVRYLFGNAEAAEYYRSLPR